MSPCPPPNDATLVPWPAWDRVLAELRGRLPRATFDTLLNGSTAWRAGDVLRVELRGEYARAWVQAQMMPLIERAVERVQSTGLAQGARPGGSRRLAIELVAAAAAHRAAEPASGPAGVEAPATSAAGDFDPQECGFVIVSNYALQFWQPYLGPRAFALWLTLRSYAYRLQGGRWPSIRSLADSCMGGHRQGIVGRGDREGALGALEQEGLVRTTVRGSGKQRTYSFEVVESLPLLSPEQVARLPAPLQAAHERFLDRAVLRERPE